MISDREVFDAMTAREKREYWASAEIAHAAERALHFGLKDMRRMRRNVRKRLTRASRKLAQQELKP